MLHTSVHISVGYIDVCIQFSFVPVSLLISFRKSFRTKSERTFIQSACFYTNEFVYIHTNIFNFFQTCTCLCLFIKVPEYFQIYEYTYIPEDVMNVSSSEMLTIFKFILYVDGMPAY